MKSARRGNADAAAAARPGFDRLKGHRSVGGLRAVPRKALEEYKTGLNLTEGDDHEVDP